MTASPIKLTSEVKVRLSAMMFLQFFIWGAWFVTLSTYLGQGLKLQGDFIGRAYSTMPWGAIVAPFIVGMIADRFFPAEKVLGILHLLGAAILYYASSVTEPVLLFWMLLGYALCYNPTLALVNAIAFNQIDNPEKQFPGIRVFGTLGWIVAGLVIGFMKVEATSIPMKVAAGCSVLAGLFAFALPHTPPKPLGQKVTVKDVLGLDALRLIRKRSFAVFVICSLLICIPLAFYYNFANLFLNEREIANAAGKMTMGQISELFFMLVMPFFFARLGVKKMLLLGMLAWFVRYLLFAFGNSQGLVFMYYVGILMQGMCFAFFFVTGQVREQHRTQCDSSQRTRIPGTGHLRRRYADRRRDLRPRRPPLSNARCARRGEQSVEGGVAGPGRNGGYCRRTVRHPVQGPAYTDQPGRSQERDGGK